MSERLVLASASRARQAMLAAAGLAVEAVPATLDEAAVRVAVRARGGDATTAAQELARAKAVAISQLRPGALVIGADQMLDCDGRWFDKPDDISAARGQLLALRGRTHRLISAVALARDGEAVWQTADEARLTMRSFSEAFLDAYLEREGVEILGCVGAYRLEALGIQLFEAVDGNHFTILGLPLPALLTALRERGTILL